jgi:hypothetical protein
VPSVTQTCPVLSYERASESMGTFTVKITAAEHIVFLGCSSQPRMMPCRPRRSSQSRLQHVKGEDESGKDGGVLKQYQLRVHRGGLPSLGGTRRLFRHVSHMSVVLGHLQQCPIKSGAQFRRSGGSTHQVKNVAVDSTLVVVVVRPKGERREGERERERKGEARVGLAPVDGLLGSRRRTGSR